MINIADYRGKNPKSLKEVASTRQPDTTPRGTGDGTRHKCVKTRHFFAKVTVKVSDSVGLVSGAVTDGTRSCVGLTG